MGSGGFSGEGAQGCSRSRSRGLIGTLSQRELLQRVGGVKRGERRDGSRGITLLPKCLSREGGGENAIQHISKTYSIPYSAVPSTPGEYQDNETSAAKRLTVAGQSDSLVYPSRGTLVMFLGLIPADVLPLNITHTLMNNSCELSTDCTIKPAQCNIPLLG